MENSQENCFSWANYFMTNQYDKRYYYYYYYYYYQ